ncbi:YciI family protein [Aporhodopirellula aestuarii]|uniref:YciI family protein n=1 Tax=Aporhodopirellula aestuarii TaxID=2950107 RepID=A0ABT0TX36_9BACT|nr:YciI family protein [Aporhodopirellula aestuarii]MCM2369100.1 YciI family protein [Aporhodopirellula aestuarii]
MKVMVMVKATKSSEAGELPSEKLLTEMGKFNEQLIDAGIMKTGEGLKPSSEGVRVRFSGANRTVTDGPFAETKELVAGYWIWEVASMEEAIEWVKRCPNPMVEESDIEIRQIYEMADFAESDPSGEIAKHEEQLAAKLATKSAVVQSYLFFEGCCEEALDFYEHAIGATVTMKMRYSESPEPMPEGMVPDGYENKIMHASFNVGEMSLMACDDCTAKPTHDGFRLALSVKTVADADLVFGQLAEGGKIDMPLSQTFWSPRFGMVTDPFGVGWMVMVAGECE